MPAPTKYNPQVAEVILEVIRETGSEARAREVVNVNCSTYSDWKRKYPELNQAVEEAKSAYLEDRKNRVLERLREAEDLVLDRFIQQLKGERHRTTSTKAKRFRRVNGRLIPVEDLVESETTVEESPFAPLITELAKKIAAASGGTDRTLNIVLHEAAPPEGTNEYEPGDELL